MNRTVFVKEMGLASSELDRKRIKKLIRRSVDSCQDNNPRGHRNLIITMEELSELSKEVAKQIRERGDSMSLTEEIADVLICLVYLQEICGVSTNDIYKAMNVKADRLERVLNEKGSYR